jgi:hypothetical protein
MRLWLTETEWRERWGQLHVSGSFNMRTFKSMSAYYVEGKNSVLRFSYGYDVGSFFMGSNCTLKGGAYFLCSVPAAIIQRVCKINT